MPLPRHASRSLRLTLVTGGLALGCLGGVAAGASVVLEATSATAPAGHIAPLPTLRVAADRAITSTVVPRPASTAASRSETRVAPAAPKASRDRHAARSRHRARQHHTSNRHRRGHGRHHVVRHHRHAARHHGTARHGTAHHLRAAHRHHVARHHEAAHRSHHAVRRHHHFTLRRDGHHLSRMQKINRVIAVARAQRGKPYVWGAAGPHAFDCSGYVQWVFRHAIGRRLPKYTDTQYDALTHIRARKLRRGDLIFVREGRHESHVGIYAGHHRWWVAPHTGSHVKLQRVWGWHNVYARVIH